MSSRWGGLWEVAIGLSIVVAVSLLGCCKQLPPPETVKPACLLEPPPADLSVKFAGPEQGCPPPWVACVTASDALSLTLNVRAKDLWIAVAYAKCGPTPGERNARAHTIDSNGQ